VFFLPTLPPPTAPPFPYTTLFRSCREVEQRTGHRHVPHVRSAAIMPEPCMRSGTAFDVVHLRRHANPPLVDAATGIEFQHHHPRSEEHTSELQSRENLVCRLLLEK